MGVSHPQSQASLVDQLRAVVSLAVHHGYYDAALWLERHLEGIERHLDEEAP